MGGQCLLWWVSSVCFDGKAMFLLMGGFVFILRGGTCLVCFGDTVSFHWLPPFGFPMGKVEYW